MSPPFRVLLATDGSEFSHVAADLLLRLPFPLNVEVTILNVAPILDPLDASHEAVIKQLREEADKIVSEEAKRLAELGLNTRTLVRVGDVSEQILNAASELRCDLVVVGSHGLTGLSHFLMGSVAEKVVKYSSGSVLVARAQNKAGESDSPGTDGDRQFRMLVAFDGSEPANAAVKFIAGWPLERNTEVTLLGVQTVATTFYRIDIMERLAESWNLHKQELQAQLDAAALQLRETTPTVNTILREGGPDASREILDTARQLDAELVIVGHKGKSAVERFLLGNVSNRVVHHADRSVLVVRP